MIIDKLKSYAIAALALITGLFYALFRVQQRKTEQAEAGLAKATFKLTTKENDDAYLDAKARADKLVSDYQSGKRSDTVE